jgi:hypothetical protein
VTLVNLQKVTVTGNTSIDSAGSLYIDNVSDSIVGDNVIDKPNGTKEACVWDGTDTNIRFHENSIQSATAAIAFSNNGSYLNSTIDRNTISGYLSIANATYTGTTFNNNTITSPTTINAQSDFFGNNILVSDPSNPAVLFSGHMFRDNRVVSTAGSGLQVTSANAVIEGGSVKGARFGIILTGNGDTVRGVNITGGVNHALAIQNGTNDLIEKNNIVAGKGNTLWTAEGTGGTLISNDYAGYSNVSGTWVSLSDANGTQITVH